MKKKNMLLALAAMLFVGMLGTTVQADTPLYRLYNKGLKVHLYTKDTNEYAVLGTRGWSQEGVAWNTEDQQGEPVYRLYNRGLKVHLYTKDANEYAVLATRGWSQEGVAFRSFGETPVYRLYNRGLKKHLYTKDANEYAVLATRGWSQEGVAFMALSNKKVEAEKPAQPIEPMAPTQPVYPNQPNLEKDLYTENPTEYDVHVRYFTENDGMGSMTISGVTIRRGEVASLPRPSGYKVKSAILMTATSDAFGVHRGEVIMDSIENNQMGELPFSTLDKLYVKTKYRGWYIWEVTWIKE